MTIRKQISNHALAAKMIKAELKKRFGSRLKSVKSDSYANGSSVRAEVSDLTPDEAAAAESFMQQFTYGKFDSYNDIYEYDTDKNDLPKVKYTFLDNAMSVEMQKKIIEWHNATFVDQIDPGKPLWEQILEDCRETASNRLHQLFHSNHFGFFKTT